MLATARLKVDYSSDEYGYEFRNRVLDCMGYRQYSDYLNSEMWATIRSAKLVSVPDCELCGKKANEVHHFTYHYAVMTGQNDTLLVSLCSGCHRKIECHKGYKLLACDVRQYLCALLDRFNRERSKELRLAFDKVCGKCVAP